MAPPPPPSAPKDPNRSPRITAITLLAEDLALSKRFYEQAFCVEPVHEDEHSAAFYFNDRSLAVNLYMPFGVREDRPLGRGEHAGRVGEVGRRLQLSVAVASVDEVYARLRGLEGEEGEDGEGMGNGSWKGKDRALVVEGLTEPRLRPWGVRTVTFQDPSGHCWEVVQEA